MLVFDTLLYLLIGYWLDRVVASEFGAMMAGDLDGRVSRSVRLRRRITSDLVAASPQVQLL